MRASWRVIVVIVAALGLAGLFLELRPEEKRVTTPAASVEVATTIATTSSRPSTRLIRIAAEGTRVTRATIDLGERVTLVVTGPAGEEVHLHGYDVRRDIGPGGAARLPFHATIPGRFEVELEGAHRQIADLTVR